MTITSHPEYEAYFQAEVEAALREADDASPDWLSNDEVKRKSAARRALWLREVDRARHNC